MSKYDGLSTLRQIYEHNCSNKSDIHEHCPTLYELAKESDHITEFGSRWCVSTSALLYAQPKKMVCYDISKHGTVGIMESLAGETEFVFHTQDTREAAIEETDFLFIDTWHAYSQLKVELKLHADKVKKYIALHDTETYGKHGDTVKGTRPAEPGLRLAIDEFLKDNSHWKQWKHYSNNNGLTILKRS